MASGRGCDLAEYIKNFLSCWCESVLDTHGDYAGRGGEWIIGAKADVRRSPATSRLCSIRADDLKNE